MLVHLVSHSMMTDQICGLAASVCTNSSDIKKSLEAAMASHHDSVLEHCSYTFVIFGISRACMAQFTRHRLASFSVQGQRYNKITDKTQIVIPPSIKGNPEAERIFKESADKAVNTYMELIDQGIAPEDARYVLPEGCACELMVTMNARELKLFLSLRQCNRAQWEIRAVADDMAEQLKKISPIIFKDAGPGCVRGDCPEGKLCCKHPRTDLKNQG